LVASLQQALKWASFGDFDDSSGSFVFIDWDGSYVFEKKSRRAFFVAGKTGVWFCLLGFNNAVQGISGGARSFAENGNAGGSRNLVWSE
jgi:hypothetical protein